ncbi:MAG TPA: helix-turn-helix transcriptional regulator, partial [Actinomycetota bacterium]|nr:helix-turn-helix transcriptional regulator [Actinomycetota bacterium]
MSERTGIGHRLRRLRTARGLTQRELGSPRYTHAYVSTIEAGRRRPSREALEHFAGKLGVTVDELATGRAPDLVARLRFELQEARADVSAGRSEAAESGLERIVRTAKRFGLTRIRAAALEISGLRLLRSGQPEEALQRYQAAEELIRDEAPTARVDAVDGKATCFHALGDVRYAVFLLESLLDEIERSGLRDPDALARVHSGLVFFYLDAGLYAKAAGAAAELERLAPRLRDPARVAQMHMNVARQYLTEGRTEDAERSLGRAEDIYRQLRLLAEIGGAHLARGYVLSREGRFEEARQELERALATFEETGDVADLTRTLNELGRVERLEGRVDRARELLERSIALLGTRDAPILGWAHRELGFLLAERQPTTAEKHLRTAIEVFERTEQPVDLAISYRALGDVLGAGGDPAGASDAYRTGILALER